MTFFSTLGVCAFSFSFPLLARDVGITGMWLGSTFTGFFIAKLLVGYLAGILADKIGPRPLLIFSILLGTLIPLGYLFNSPSLPIYLVQFGLGIVIGIIKPVSMAVIGAESSEEYRGKLFGWYNTFFYAALIGGPLLGGFLYHQKNPLPVILSLFLCMLVSLLILILFFPGNISLSRKISQKPVSGISAEKGGEFLTLLLAVAGRTAGIAIIISFLPILMMERLSYNSLTLGVFFSLPTLVTCLALPLSGRLADHFNKISLTLAGMLICASSLLFVGKVQTPTGIIAVLLFLGIGSAISIPASMSEASIISSEQGKTMGIFYGAANLGFILGPLLGGLSIKAKGLPGAFWVIGIIGIISCLPLSVSFAKNIVRFRHLDYISSSIAITLILVFSVVTFLVPVRAVAKERFRFANLAMGTYVQLTLKASDENVAERAADNAFAIIHKLEKDISHRSPTGSVGRINSAAGKKPVKVTSKAFKLIKRALLFSEKSDGVFDISVGAISTEPEYYNNYYENKNGLVNYRLVQLNSEDSTVFLPRMGMSLDLGGMAKGTIIDSAVDAIKKDGISAGIVEAGGDLFCFGNENWNIGIEHPRMEGLLGVISIRNMAVCSSGDYRQYSYSVKQHKRKHHIIDPQKMSSAGKSISVTVVAPNAELADALATTLFIMGPEKGKEFLRKKFPDSSAFWVLPDLNTIKTRNFPPFLTR
ncbi:MAG: MFS transporter [Thermodesulfobacteriota bacterium]|nr:MFS transporter [Thermodesulfobacteriota bacterium]